MAIYILGSFKITRNTAKVYSIGSTLPLKTVNKESSLNVTKVNGGEDYLTVKVFILETMVIALLEYLKMA